MKKLLITLSAVAVTLLAFTATADAGHTVRYLAGYDACGRPIYCYKTVPTVTFNYGHIHRPASPHYGRSYGHSYGHSRSHGYGHSYSHRPSYGHGHGRSYCR